MNSMTLGIIFGLAACVIWGLIFIIPTILSDFSAFEVVLGRYFTYGIFSSLLLFRKGFSPLKAYKMQAWVTALLFGLIANIFYYIGMVVGLRFASPPITVLIVGLAPIVIVFYGNWKIREISYKQMILPSLWILAGMVLVNFAEVDWSFTSYSLQEYLLGFGGILLALSCWSLYVVHNSRYLKRNPQINLSEWATIMGVATFFWVILFAFLMNKAHLVDLKQFLEPSAEVAQFFIGTAALGVLCSWLGCFLWNKATSYLPVSLIGPLSIFETVFGLVFVYGYEGRLPTIPEALGIVSMVGGTALAIYSFRKSSYTHS